MYIGEKVSFRRKQLGLTQDEVCRGICSITYLSKLENNKLIAKNDILEMICNRLNLNINELFENDFENHMNNLRDLYLLVTNREISQFKNKFVQLNTLRNITNPILRVGLDSILLEFHTELRNKKESEKFKNNIMKNEMYLNNETKVWYLKALGYFEYIFEDLNKSSKFLYEAKSLIPETNRDNISAHVEYLLGLVNTKLMLISRSVMHTEKALELYNKEINIKRIIDCKLLLGINFSKMGHYDIAEEMYKSIAETLIKSKNKRMLGKVYHNLGYLYALNDKSEDAILYFKKSLELKLDTNEKLNTMYLLAYEYKKQGDINLSLRLCDQGIKNSTEILHFHYKFIILKKSYNTNDFNEDIFINKIENEIIPYFIKQDPLVSTECFYLLAEIFSNKSKYKLAVKYYKKALETNIKNSRKELLY
jgi:HTH-type transcriptional regulator, quorum sensing regulator NprR